MITILCVLGGGYQSRDREGAGTLAETAWPLAYPAGRDGSDGPVAYAPGSD